VASSGTVSLMSFHAYLKNLSQKELLIKSGTSNIVLPPQLSFPVIAKPDMGERGKGVTLVHDLATLQRYADTINQDFIIQEFCDFPQEAAIFYIRKPSESRGRITSFTTKEFLSVTGDGHQTIGQLMSLSFRARLQNRKNEP
jgi:phosphoribosylaminoimidazole carboxylase (NCAIR synthetase)